MALRSSSLLGKAALLFIVLTLLTINLVPAWQNYQIRLSLKSENPGGSTLAERYLKLGGWPASKMEKSAITQSQKYSMATSDMPLIESGRAR